MDEGLIAFLNARLDEDEAAAKAWLPLGNPTAMQREHIARQDPGRVLREVEAKRVILGRHKPLSEASSHLACAWCSDDVDTVSLDMRWPCPDVLSLAAVYSDHPDYRPEWKP